MSSLPFGNLDDAQLLKMKNNGAIDQTTFDDIMEMRGTQQKGGSVFKSLGLSRVHGPIAEVLKAPEKPQIDYGTKVSVEQRTQTKGGPMDGPIASIRHGADVTAEGIAAGGEAEAQESATLAELGAKQDREWRLKFGSTYESLQYRREHARQLETKNADALRADADMMVRYPGMDVDEVKASQGRLDAAQARYANSNDPAERKRAAQEIKREQGRLAAAQDIDDSGGMTGANRIMAAIAMGLGAYGASLARTPNYAMQIIQSQIDRNIAAQKERHAKQTRAGEIMQSRADQMVSKKMAEYQDELQQTAALEIIYLQQAKRMAEQVSVRSKAPQAKANAMKLIGDLEMRAGEKIGELVARGEQLEVQKMSLEARQAGKKDGDHFTAIKSDLRRLIQLRDKHESETLPGNVKSTMNTLSKSIALRAGRIHGQGRMSDLDLETIKEAMGDATAYGFQLAKMQEMLRIIEGIEREAGGEVYRPEDDELLADFGEPQ